ncbi:hypothetical protein [Anabaena lutea]|nr:hypothetical protein [Anabaena lutea]
MKYLFYFPAYRIYITFRHLQKCDAWGEESDRYNLRTYEKTLKL